MELCRCMADIGSAVQEDTYHWRIFNNLFLALFDNYKLRRLANESIHNQGDSIGGGNLFVNQRLSVWLRVWINHTNNWQGTRQHSVRESNTDTKYSAAHQSNINSVIKSQVSIQYVSSHPGYKQVIYSVYIVWYKVTQSVNCTVI